MRLESRRAALQAIAKAIHLSLEDGQKWTFHDWSDVVIEALGRIDKRSAMNWFNLARIAGLIIVREKVMERGRRHFRFYFWTKGPEFDAYLKSDNQIGGQIT